ncbi:hypothetical protein B0H21DRAFT_146428 [Amylocystis lapponica]|nr:hypothetical protein B0H21DRAFT_146428 [Amylocystis lapponica]
MLPVQLLSPIPLFPYAELRFVAQAIATCPRLRLAYHKSLHFTPSRPMSRAHYPPPTPPSDRGISRTASPSPQPAVSAAAADVAIYTHKSVWSKRCSLFVAGFPPLTKEDDLIMLFERFGKIISIDLHPHGFVFILFPSKNIVQKIVNLAKSQSFVLDGKRLTVQRVLQTFYGHTRPRQVFVDNIPMYASHDDILRVFLPYGAVRVKPLWLTDPFSGECSFSGSAHVRFCSEQDAERVVKEWPRWELDGQQLKVSPAGWMRKGLLPPSATLCVRNIPLEAGESILRELFGQFGDIKEVRFARSYMTGRSKCRAFVEFVSLDDSRKVLDAHEQNPFSIRGAALNIDYAGPFIPSLSVRGEPFHIKARKLRKFL